MRPHGTFVDDLFPQQGIRTRRHYTYFVWPSGSLTARVACASLATAMQERGQGTHQDAGDIWVVRSDAVAVRAECTACDSKTEAVLVATHTALWDYWCPPCMRRWGTYIVDRRLSTLQGHLLCWLLQDIQRIGRVVRSDHADLVRAIQADKGNISKSLRNLAAKHYIVLTLSPGRHAVSVQLTPLGVYLARAIQSCA